MLSSLSKLLPTNLNLNPLEGDIFRRHSTTAAEVHVEPATPLASASTPAATAPHEQALNDDETDREGDPASSIAAAVSPSKGKKKNKDPVGFETFIIVRPPPSATNHPLNLQVQLLPNSRGDRAIRQSIDLNASRETLPDTGEIGVPLVRTTSARSNRSDTESTYSSGSMSSYGSSNSGVGRRVIPLYNLHAHNVMTNTITDAGTDAKVAKFFKRGLEIMGLAMLEPVEVWGIYNWDEDEPLQVDGPRLSTLSAHSLPQPVITTTLSPVPEVPASPAPSGQKTPEPRKLFGKFFKKKDTSTPSPPTVTNAPTTPTVPTAPITPIAPVPVRVSEPILQPQILGLQAILQSPTIPPIGRANTYVWVFRKWIKNSGEGWLGGVASSIGGTLGIKDGTERNASAVTLVEVRFEWKRGKSAGDRRKRSTIGGGSGFTAGGSKDKRRHSSVLERRDTSSTVVSSAHDGTTTSSAHGESNGNNLTVGGLSRSASTSAQNKRENRLSFPGITRKDRASLGASNMGISQQNTPDASRTTSRAASPNPPASVATNTTADDGIDDGEESDPEDSETPWICTIKLRKSKPAVAPEDTESSTTPSISHESSSDHGSSKPHYQTLRLKVASLAPAPHHPRVVGQIKTSFPMPDVLIDKLEVRQRTMGAPRPEYEPGVLVLTGEEIKDVVTCTALWLVVREGFGGLTKKRKGDGWRLRG